MTISYATLDQFQTRYDLEDSASAITSDYLFFASRRVDAALAPAYTTPFSSNNYTATDLAIDHAYVISQQRSKDPKEDWEALKKCLMDRYKALLEGKEYMATTSGGLEPNSPGNALWSSNQDYKPALDMRDPEDQHVDVDRLNAEALEDC